MSIAENQNIKGNFKINPWSSCSHNLFELNKLICWSNYFKNTNTPPAVYSQRWRNKVASTLICIIFEKALYTAPYKPPALHNGVKTYLKSQLIISYSFLIHFQIYKMMHGCLKSTVIQRRQYQLGRMADFSPPVTFSVFDL